MALLIGMDEAGLGPNLGPFVVAATAWEVPGSPADFDFWTAFDTVLTCSPVSCDPRLHIADSKQVFQPHRGLATLERGVLSALHLSGLQAGSYRDLCRKLAAPASSTSPRRAGRSPNNGRHDSLFGDEELSAARRPVETACSSDDHQSLPWYDGEGLALPVESSDLKLVDPWRTCCDRVGVRLLAIRADVVEPLRFNRLVRHYDNKAQATSRLAMNLLRSLWHPDDGPALIVADKHGGRNRYEPLLSDIFGGPIELVTEGAEKSAYRLGQGEIRFQPRAESCGPVALASMTAKYLREVAMHQFNGFWRDRIPGLKPTQGYPVDAKRFYAEIAAERRRLELADALVWRER